MTENVDQLFVSAGEYGEFIDLWLNGEKLTEEKIIRRKAAVQE